MNYRWISGGPERDAGLAACLLAVDPAGLGGIAVRAPRGPAVDRLIALLRSLMPGDAPLRRVPLQIADDRLIGGLDLSATLRAGRPVFQRGILAEADGGCILLPMAERCPSALAARLCAVLDERAVTAERDGFASRLPARIAIIALDEGRDDEARPPAGLLDRLALHLDLSGLAHREDLDAPFSPDGILAAREALAGVQPSEEVLTAFCAAAQAMGIGSVRAPLLAMRAARAHAALAGRDRPDEQDAVVAARLVLAPRATELPAAEASPEQADEARDDAEPPTGPPTEPATGSDADGPASVTDGELAEIVLEAVHAAIPSGLLEQLRARAARATPDAASGRAGEATRSTTRGRPTGTVRGVPKGGARLDLVATLRAAAPWQRLRRVSSDRQRIAVRLDDLHIVRLARRAESATLFVVDASGSAALHRLAEAKGAVARLLADCYVRRDRVALLAFRGRGTELLLPPTRSLARAKRSLAALPGGGGTPMASAIDAAVALADGLERKGLTTRIVFLTDGRANIARDGSGGRERAEADALDSARRCRAMRLGVLLVDTSPSRGPAAERLAAEMGARYLALPRGDAAAIARAVRDAPAAG